MEVLVAVGLIAIISAIAVPQFQDYREQTGLVAGDTSMGNIARAYQNCISLNSFTECNSLSKIKISCSDCSDLATLQTSAPYCANYKKDAGGKEFKMCVSIDSNGSVSKTIGGDFQVCHKSCTGGGCGTGDTGVITPIKRCSAQANCNSVKPSDVTGTNPKTFAVTCPATPTTSGTCTAGACG